ncbi:tyrosine protein kinase, partial [Phocaeicola dorei]|nr:tyrosine protein kinase [Phocaeicola dorei]MBV3608407.1 tyrosine protein kinase [Phocaeicola dorei]
AIASRVADMCVYVCRADVTPKLGYQYINVLRDQKKFDKLATVINSIDLNSRKSGYGYGHKYGYGYGHKYGYGYGMDNSKKD